VVLVADDPVRIAQFWQAVEIFSPQSLPRLDQRNHTVDYRDGDYSTWGSERYFDKLADPAVLRRYRP
jgi:hypothetical protein